MRADEARGLGALAGLTLAGGVRRVAEFHLGVADRVLSAVHHRVGPAVTPVRRVHDGIAGSAYTAVQVALEAGARATGLAVARAARDDGSLADHPNARLILGALNGLYGDVLDRDLRALALPMSLRHDGHDLVAETGPLRAAYPDASPRLVVFLHGLAETEDAWRFLAARRHGDRSVTYGTLLRRDLGYTPIWVRYNSGLHISDNGRQLAALLDRLVEAWPVPVRDLVLIGHSMGGLVARSALAQAGDGTPTGQRHWPGLVRDTITLGSPHLGAPLEQAVTTLARRLGGVNELRWLATSLRARSAGIKDLRYGNLLEADWTGHDPDDAVDHRTSLPLHAGARHFVVVATLAGSHESWLGDLVGDLFVRPRSASGDTDDDTRLAFPHEHVSRLVGLHHFDLLNHPTVYAQIHGWLVRRPGGDGAGVGPGPAGAATEPADGSSAP